MAARLPLADVKVLDFFWVLAGPGVTRSMADYGATVVRIESTQRVDPTRTVGPFKDNNTNPEFSALFGNNNAGKLSLSLDLSKPAAREVVLDLVRWADIVTESFSPKAMRAWGFDYESLRAIKPDLIMISSCLMGQTGPLARFAGFGNLAAALCGFYNLVGWPDRTPSGPFSAYTDYIAPRFGLAAVMAALIHRKRTGEGQYIDQAQAESALQFLTLPILDTVGSGRKYSPIGNDDLLHAPHGVYPAGGQKAGEAPRQDRWVAIACRTDAQWRALCSAIGQPQLADDARFNSFAARYDSRAELDRIIGEWTRLRTPDETERVLQASGVPAHTVQTTFDAHDDPQLRHREHFVRVNHPIAGDTYVENSRFKLSRTPAVVNRSGPALGHHSQYVFEQILGYDESRISELVAGGVLG
jgi:crotonobetainyl-CoA:carnitine CoA-transferase CaiB-like acyl-CoA transferase